MFKFSITSIGRMEGVNPKLIRVVDTALMEAKVDFSVISGVRTLAEQKELVAKGFSWTLNSKHLTGHAIDLAPWIEGESKWTYTFYDDLFRSMRLGAIGHGMKIRWGGAWHLDDIREWQGTGCELVDDYKRFYHATNPQGEGPSIDAPHFEICS